MFGRRFKKLIESDRYKNSNYTIEKVNGLYALKDNRRYGYVDLWNKCYTWDSTFYYYSQCFSYFKSPVIAAFNYRVPITKPVKSLIRY